MASNKNNVLNFWLFTRRSAGLTGGKKALLAALGTGIMSLTLAYGRYDRAVFTGYFSHPLIALLNILPVLLVFLLLYSAIGRSWIAHLVTSLLVLGLSTADYFLLLCRDDTLLFALTPEHITGKRIKEE